MLGILIWLPAEHGPGMIRQMRLHFRATNQQLELHFDFIFPETKLHDKFQLSLDFGITSSRPVWSFVLYFYQQPDDPETGPRPALWSLRWPGGSEEQTGELPKSEKFFDAESFDFDWLFGPVSDDENLPDALAPERLNRRPEAQARLIGQSDPFDIKFQ